MVTDLEVAMNTVVARPGLRLPEGYCPLSLRVLHNKLHQYKVKPLLTRP